MQSPIKTRILFVDDEPMLLKALQRMLFSYEEHWDSAFAESGQQALQIMAEQEFDVIVSDMRMPGMNGNELMAEVQQRHPSTVRFVLSGHADLTLINESTSCAHQYLSKPCDENELKARIEHCSQARAMLSDPSLINLVTGFLTIPSCPSLHQAIVELMKSDSANIDNAALIVDGDIGMTLKVLQLVNAGFFSSGVPIVRTAEALQMLGLDTFKSLVLTSNLFSPSTGKDLLQPELRQIEAAGVRTAQLAKLIARSEGANEALACAAELAGRLSCLGQLILTACLPEQNELVQSAASVLQVPLSTAEERVIGSTTNLLAAYLLSLWAIPESVVQAVAHCHDPSSVNSTGFTPLTALHAALAIESASSESSTFGDSSTQSHEMDSAYLERLGLTHHVAGWQQLQLLNIGETA